MDLTGIFWVLIYQTEDRVNL